MEIMEETIRDTDGPAPRRWEVCIAAGLMAALSALSWVCSVFTPRQSDGEGA
ncbi:MAG: hypothetical protein VX464_20760 [Pseudomonadota bacterium]|nr:hypothetical protein [Pseudomonadota bacterium]